MTRSLNRDDFAFTAHFEGVYLYAYVDPGTGGEPITIGIGATVHDGLGRVRLGDTISLTEAVRRFRRTMEDKYIPEVHSAIRRSLEHHQWFVLYDFHYNTGAIRSGTVDDKLNRVDDDAALATLGAYVRAGGREMAGLKRRRQAEIDLWRNGRYPPLKITVRDAPGSYRLVAPANLPWDVPERPQYPVTVDIPTLPESPPLPERNESVNILWNLLKALWSLISNAKSCKV